MPEFQQGNEGRKPTIIMTRLPHYPTPQTRELVQYLTAQGLDEKQIAAALRCTPDEVQRFYADELEHGLTLVNSRVMSAVLHEALYSRDVSAMKLWLINKAGWRAGDGSGRALSLVNPQGEVLPEGEMTVVQRREVINKMLTQASQFKRRQEHVIEAEVVPAKKNGSTNGNGVKHR